MSPRRGILAAFLGAVILSPAIAVAQGSSPGPAGTAGLPSLTHHINDVKSFVASLVVALLSAIAFLLIPYVAVRIVRIRRSRQLVIANFTDATGDAAFTDAALGGLSQLLRERLLTDLDRVGRTIKDTIGLAGLFSAPLIQQQMTPRVTPDDTLHSLTDSVQGLVGTEASPAVRFIGDTLLKPTGTNVTLTLQHRDRPEGTLGVTIGVSDLRDVGAPEFDTLWDRDDEERLDDLLRDPYEGGQVAEGSGPGAVAPDQPGDDWTLLRRVADRVKSFWGARRPEKAPREGTEQSGPVAPAPAASSAEVSLPQRFRDDLPQLARLLSLQLFRRDLIADQARRMLMRLSPIEIVAHGWRAAKRSREWEDEGRIRNYIGLLLQTSAAEFGSDPPPGHYGIEFYRRALAEFRHAARLIRKDYRPYENLGDTFSLVAQSFLTHKPDAGSKAHQRAQHALDRAFESYEHALDLLDAAVPRRDGRKRRLRRISVGVTSKADADRARRILLADLSTTAYKSAIPARVDKASGWLEEATTGLDLSRERVPYVTYAFAVCLTLRARAKASRGQDPNQDITAARRALAFATTRDVRKDFWTDAMNDPDLEQLFRDPRDRNTYTAFLRELEKVRTAEPCIPCLDGRRFEAKIQEVASRAGWRISGRTS